MTTTPEFALIGVVALVSPILVFGFGIPAYAIPMALIFVLPFAVTIRPA